MADIFYSTQGFRITLGSMIGEGGEGKIYRIVEDSSLCVKIFHVNRREPKRFEKVSYMAAHPPKIPAYQQGIINLAWPRDVVVNKNGSFVGFTMNYTPKNDYIDVFTFFHSKDRFNAKANFTWADSLIVAFYISATLTLIHNSGICVGDLKDTNIWISKKDNSVIFLDCDSFQITDSLSGKVYYCTVRTTEYEPPEQISLENLDGIDRKFSDLFALGTLLFQLLMEGTKPYAASGKGVPGGSYFDKIKAGLFPYGNLYLNVEPPRHAPPLEILPPSLQKLFIKCFIQGHKKPETRPTAKEWFDAINSVIAPDIRVQCKVHPNHVYLNHCTVCPWCDLISKKNIDYYPDPIIPVQKQKITSAVKGTSSSRGQTTRYKKPIPAPSSSFPAVTYSPPSTPSSSSGSVSSTSSSLRSEKIKKSIYILSCLVLLLVLSPVALDYIEQYNQDGLSINPQDNVKPTSVTTSLNSKPYTVVHQWGAEGENYGESFWPADTAIDNNGNLFVAGASGIQKFDRSGNFITEWGRAGDVDREIWFAAIAIDSQGNVYTVNHADDRIEKYDNSGTFITSWGSSGSSDGQFLGLTGIAIDDYDNIFVIDDGSRIHKFDSSGNFITKWGSHGSGTGQFNRPWSLSIDKEGYVYVVDAYDYRIQKFDNAGNFITTWGSEGEGKGQFGMYPQIEVDDNGNVYVADWDNNRIQQFDSSGQFITQWGGSFRPERDNSLRIPDGGLALDKTGNVYVVDRIDNRILKYTVSDSGVISDRSTSATQDYQSLRNYHEMIKKPIFTLDLCSMFGGCDASNYPYRLNVDIFGNIYVLTSNSIQKYSSSGTFLGELQSQDSPGSGDGQIYWNSQGDLTTGPQGIVTDKSGNVYVVDTGNHRIQKFAPDGHYLLQWGNKGEGAGKFLYPSGIGIDNENNLYIVDSEQKNIQKFSDKGEFILSWGNGGVNNDELFNPSRIAIDNKGFVYILDINGLDESVKTGNQIKKFTIEGEFITSWGPYGDRYDGEMRKPRDIAIDQDGNILVVDSYQARILKFSAEGRFLEAWGVYKAYQKITPGTFVSPTGISLDSEGNVFISDYGGARIQKFAKNTPIIEYKEN